MVSGPMVFGQMAAAAVVTVGKGQFGSPWLVSTPRAPRSDLVRLLVQQVQVNVRRLDPGVSLPGPAHPGDAGLDLTARESVVIDPGDRAAVPTGIALDIPTGYAGLVLPRSGHAWRHGIALVNSPGLIDSGYRGEIQVLLINHGKESVRFERGERVAQLVIVAVPTVTWEEVDQLSDSRRGAAGFGSTGR